LSQISPKFPRAERLGEEDETRKQAEMNVRVEWIGREGEEGGEEGIGGKREGSLRSPRTSHELLRSPSVSSSRGIYDKTVVGSLEERSFENMRTLRNVNRRALFIRFHENAGAGASFARRARLSAARYARVITSEGREEEERERERERVREGGREGEGDHEEAIRRVSAISGVSFYRQPEAVAFRPGRGIPRSARARFIIMHL